ncbi:MAG: zinc ABC transporter substrate-binding protein [Rhodospirillales bacterium]|nr:zinc ABC transporter substrate-binding protein [Rhodospirillales bacterium]
MPAPQVVASILPIHSLIAGVMRGVGKPQLLIKGGASPHAYSLRPSDARLLSKADAIFWIGGGMERYLAKPITARKGAARIVELSRAIEIDLIKASGGREADLHLWLDPHNAQVIIRTAVSTLRAIDPQNASRYQANGDSMIDRVAQLDTEIKANLAATELGPFVVFHDAYGYFERRYGLRHLAAVTINPDRVPGARGISELRRRIKTVGAVCIFTEPQFKPSILNAVADGLNIKRGVLDPMGADITPGIGAYFTLLKDIANAFIGCAGLS